MTPREKGALFVFRFLVGTSAVVIILAGMKAAAAVLVPFLLALFITIIVTPVFFWLQRRGVSSGSSLVLMFLALGVLSFLGGSLIDESIRDFAGKLPGYQTKFREDAVEVIQWLNTQGMQIDSEEVLQQLNPSALFQFTGSLLAAASGLLGQTFIVLLIVIFMLFEASILPKKIRSLPDITPTMFQQLERSVLDVRSYMGIKSVMSLITGLCVIVLNTVIGIDYALLLGLIAFLLNFVPNIGSFMAAIPAVLLAVLDKDGLGAAGAVVIGYVIINVSISNFIEPRFMGRGLGLSTLWVILSLIFWGWMLGPIGMLLSIPLTMVVKVGLETVEATRWIAVLMGGDPGVRQKK